MSNYKSNKVTPAQFEVIELLALGLSVKEIAQHLEKSVKTVDNLIQQAKQRLHFQKNTELVAWYYKTRYHITLSITNKLKRFVSAALLGLSLIVITHNSNEFVRTARVRTSRSGSRREYTELKLTA